MKTLRSLFLAVALAGSAPASGAMDTLFLKDGRVYDKVRLQLEEDTFVVGFENGDIRISRDHVAEYVMLGTTGQSAPSPAAEEKLAKGLVPFQGKWLKPERREREVQRLIKEQEEAAQELKDSRLWRNRRRVESKHFAYEYTVSEAVFEAYRERMETYYEVFEKLWKIRRGKLGKLKVRCYVDPQNFHQITGTSRGVLAFFEWVEPPYRLQFYYDHLAPLDTERTVFHEFGHYLQKLTNQDFQFSHWPGEALAEYYSTGSWDPKRKKFEVDAQVLEGRLISIRRDMEDGDYVTIEDLVGNSNEGDYHDYTWGWSLVHFLMGDSKTAKSFEKFYLGLARSKSVDRKNLSILKNTTFAMVEGSEMLAYFKKCLRIKSDGGLQALQESWYRHIEELEVSSAQGLAKAAESARRYGRKFRAKRLYQEAIEAGGAASLVFHRYAQVLDSLDENDAAWEAWKTAVEMDPLVADYYIWWGVSMTASAARSDEGKRLLRLAREIEPDNIYLERNLKRLLAE